MSSFKFALNDFVMLSMSAEKGQVIGQARYTAMEHQYLVRYVAADGCQGECWISESALDIQPPG
jgi:hypothetical protein